MGYREQFFAECHGFSGGLSGLSVLVAGCGRGLDCAPFVDAGAKVCGLDICDDIGCELPSVRYVRASIEDCGLPGDCFDVIFCITTMEHVIGIERAFAEMVRVVRPGGLIFSVASPLWNSRRGHHMDCLNPFPWIHLRMNRRQIVELANKKGILHDGIEMQHMMDYLFVGNYFNRHHSVRYVHAVRNLSLARILRHHLWMDGEDELTSEIALALKEFRREELLATAHILVARK
jgi:SAM-dependent methyltransferase